MAKMERAARPAGRPRGMGLCSEVADGGGKSGGPPRPREQIRLPHGPVSAGNWPRQMRPGHVEPFSFHPDKTLPGTLHHSGNRPAPPSDHIPLARRSAFQRGRRGNSDARAGLERIQQGLPCRRAAICQQMENGNFVVPRPLLAMRRVKHRSRADARNAPTDVLIWARRGYSRPAPGIQPDANSELHFLVVQF
jgi:hypothetical protein